MSDHPYARVIQKHPAFPQRKEVGNVREQMVGGAGVIQPPW
jgi:hypothetical protein